MKKLATICTAILMAVLCAFPAAGCKKKSKKQTYPAVRKEVIADFETYDDVINMLTKYNNVSFTGAYTLASLSDRPVADRPAPLAGNDMFEWRIDGTVGEIWAGYDKTSGTPAHICYNLFDNTKVRDKENGWGFNWKYLCGTSVDIYNDNDFDIRVAMSGMFYNGFSYNYGSVTVPAKQKTTLHVNVNRYFMQKENTKTLSIFNFAVDYDKQMQPDGTLYYPQAYVYFDNITAEFIEEDVYDDEGNPIIDKTFSSDDEILSFDTESDLRFMREFGHQYVKESDNLWDTVFWFEGTGSSYHYNTNAAYVTPGRKGSLEWRVNPTFQSQFNTHAYRYLTDKNYMDPNARTGITVCGDYLNYINLSYLQEKKASIKVDVFNAGTFDKEVGFGIHDQSGISQSVQTEPPYDYGALYSNEKWYKLKKGEWTTLTLDDFSQVDMSKGLARLQLVTSLLDVNEEISFYVNNLRVDYGNGQSAPAGKVSTATGDAFPKIFPSYTYKIVQKSAHVDFPAVQFSKSGLTVTYTLNGETVQPNAGFTPASTGTQTLAIVATDAEGRKATKKVVYTVTDNAADLNKVYAFDDPNGVAAHLGRGALNELGVSLVTFADEKDAYGNSLTPNAEMLADGITAGIKFKSYRTLGRAVLTEPLHFDWNDKFDRMYFWFYNAGYDYVTLTINNYERTFQAATGWNKVIIGESTVPTAGGGTKTVTDYELISSEGISTTLNGMIDLEDCVGSFLMFKTRNDNNEKVYYEEFAMSAIYGVPKAD